MQDKEKEAFVRTNAAKRSLYSNALELRSIESQSVLKDIRTNCECRD